MGQVLSEGQINTFGITRIDTKNSNKDKPLPTHLSKEKNEATLENLKGLRNVQGLPGEKFQP